ncbi:Plant-specific TFIIB-related protein [Actinidia chinensis var. chinensis]|uniref:Plant-specific TFIIB-related protein n=1 Tax=Actinidia chinensis var. chinensis TaxID=1590841 RepID=A0A2R6S2G3_ACTCC|nr:Plant-specific TFIIB-related protein [Actinidia chinensis var. chinensis]
MRCPYCSAAQGRCATTSAGRSIAECTSCGRVVEERQSQSHHLFHLRALDSPLSLVTSDLPSLPTTATATATEEEEDPFEPTGFITAFSAWSLEPYPVFAQSSISFAGHLAELERVLEATSSSSSSAQSVVVDNLRAYLQIIDVSSILGLDYDISDHAFQLFRDCSSATCLRNRSVEALATAALVQAIREAQEPRTLQEISIAANLPQKEIGKYIKILGEALQLSQPINSNSISVHMPRFCTLLQLNKSAQELATHIGEVVINKCFCTRRNPISISAAAIYLACQLEDKRKTQAEICKVTGLTEVTLRKVYKELLENLDDLLPSNYTPAVPPEKAFPTTTIPSSRLSTNRVDVLEGTSVDRDKQLEMKPTKPSDVLDACHQNRGKEDPLSNLSSSFWRTPHLPFGPSGTKAAGDRDNVSQEMEIDALSNAQELEKKADKDSTAATSSLRPNQFSVPSGPCSGSTAWPFRPPASAGPPSTRRFVLHAKAVSGGADPSGSGTQSESKKADHCEG